VIVWALLEVIGELVARLAGRLRRNMDDDEWERGTRSPLERLRRPSKAS